jgi:hypothetical protein
MRLLLDEMLAPAIARELRARGCQTPTFSPSPEPSTAPS